MDPAMERTIDSILADAVADRLAGKAPDIDAVADAHPNLAGEIRARWADMQKLQDHLGPMMESGATGHRPLAEGTRVGGFEIKSEIGRGGMGVVFEAEQQNPHRPIALKVIRGDDFIDDHTVRMFQREVEALARLKHPHIAAIYEAGRTEDGRHYFAMELVQGTPLNEYACAADLGRQDRLALFRKICDAINYAHQRGVIHRDLKPGNIMVDSEGNPKILDFGLARITDTDVKVTIMATDIGRIQGTLPYMSPEQAQGDPAEIDLRSDVYSLGVIFYELMTGQLPYDLSRAALLEAVRVICEEEPRKPSTIRRSLRGDLETIALKALQKEPARRYQSADILSEDIHRYLTSQPIVARPASAAYQLRKLVVRHKTASTFLTFLFVVVMASSVYITLQSAQLRNQRDLAEEVSQFYGNLFLVSSLERNRGLSVTARELLDVGVHRIGELAERPELQAELMNLIGAAYMNLGQSTTASSLFERSLSIRRRDLGADHPDTLAVMCNLGLAMLSLERFDEAKIILHEAFATSQRVLKAEHPDFIDYSTSYAQVLLAQGKLDRARGVLEETLRQSGADVPPEHLVKVKASLAMIFVAGGNHEEAERNLREALSIAETIWNNPDDRLVRIRNNLALALQNAGQHAEAEEHLRKCLDTRRELFGVGHPDFIQSLDNLGRLLEEQERYDDLAALLLESTEEAESVLPSDSLQLINLKYRLGKVYLNQGRLDEAERMLRASYAARRRILGEGHRSTIESLATLGLLLRKKGNAEEAKDIMRSSQLGSDGLSDNVDPFTPLIVDGLLDDLLSQGRFDEAEILAEEILRARRKELGAGHSNTLGAWIRLAQVKYVVGEDEEAVHVLRECHHAYRAEYGGGHMLTLSAQHALGSMLFDTNQRLEAESVLVDCYKSKRELYGDFDETTLATMSLLGEVLSAARKMEEAESLLTRCLKGCRSEFGESHSDTLRVANTLAVVYQNQNRLAEAENLLRDTLRTCRELLGDEHGETSTAVISLGQVLMLQGKFVEAEKAIRESLRLCEKKVASSHWLLADRRSTLGICLLWQHRTEEAESLLVDNYPLLRDALGPGHELTIAALLRLAHFYQTIGDEENLARCRKVLLSHYQGPQPPLTGYPSSQTDQ